MNKKGLMSLKTRVRAVGPLDVLWYVKHWRISWSRANGSLCSKLGLSLMFCSFYKVYEKSKFVHFIRQYMRVKI